MHKQIVSTYEGRAESLEGDSEALHKPNTAESQTGGVGRMGMLETKALCEGGGCRSCL